MYIEFFGAANGVTGSCHLVTAGPYRILLDCGLFQGRREDEARNQEAFPFDPATLDAVVLSHSHIDHSGRIPLLVQRGFKGPIYTQGASRDLCRIMLKDSAFIQEREAEIENRKRERKGLKPVAPLYTMDHAQTAMRQFRVLHYDEIRELFPGVRLRLRDAGHILGSSIVELWLETEGQRRKLVFSGDLGSWGAPILRDPTLVEDADLVVMEGTYGNRSHRSWAETSSEIRAVFSAAAATGGNVLIPAFAVGRTQDLLYLMGKYFNDWRLSDWQVWLDSPLAIEATDVYLRHSHLYDAEASRMWQRHVRQSLLPNLNISRTLRQSMALNTVRSGAIVIAASGMCNGGRIKHHLKHNLWRPECHVMFSGFQARGTLGRALVDGARHVRLWGETIQVNAQVHTIGGISAHGDQDDLIRWYRGFTRKPPVVLVHGESLALEAMAQRLRETCAAEVEVAELGARRQLA
ncbi:MAG: MBL fold metallo-hydrolase RNA specificity domain-containing protein [Thiotrichales bacterium]